MSKTQEIKDKKSRLIIAITGASGTIFGIKALECLKDTDIETHLVMSKAGERTLLEETDYSIKDVQALADVIYPSKDIGAAIASGSYRTMGMLIAPCSIKTMGEIATGITSSLVSRAADVVLKERRRLVLMVRETPLHTGHLRTMTSLSEMGAIIAPPVPGFYTKPQSVDDIVFQNVGRVLDLFDIDLPDLKRWKD
ncbi:UbiX family flavin prenyltransferase [Kordiimonas sp. SCSIO 12610]|uniref:UbiX family flavin prenyltransferase n=1 Tax=Kordiimonas sp. SCSIO 12610 TaxID=2829597 RepID=UPI002108EAD0|nr:UbiX family flavin prenyltransferase [Kordiimonas sp. SCSIO 12610]UTW55807.1 UbiX family flavin prenyltransferase [Kordiimonas sp. SCSIO 12610]